jgi:hypothetical protein
LENYWTSLHCRTSVLELLDKLKNYWTGHTFVDDVLTDGSHQSSVCPKKLPRKSINGVQLEREDFTLQQVHSQFQLVAVNPVTTQIFTVANRSDQ